MPRLRSRISKIVSVALVFFLAVGWVTREIGFAREKADNVKSQTVNLDLSKTEPHIYNGERTGEAVAYFQGDTPGSRNFITGRFVIAPGKGKTPHAPHTHAEEEVMIVESGEAEIFCDGKTTKVGPGSAMYTTPNAPHGITNLSDKPVVFYFVKWSSKASR
jgi:mannose-6-phosphate isomerase-like protein (cupin superfamily)